MHTLSHGVPHLLCRCCCCCCCYWPVRNFHIPSLFWLYKNLRGRKKKEKQMREKRRRRSGVWNKDAWERLFWLYFLSSLLLLPLTTSQRGGRIKMSPRNEMRGGGGEGEETARRRSKVCSPLLLREQSLITLCVCLCVCVSCSADQSRPESI